MKALERYRASLKVLLESRLRYEALQKADLAAALELQARHGLLSTDSLIAAAALRLNAVIATTDRAFGRLEEPKAYLSDDI